MMIRKRIIAAALFLTCGAVVVTACSTPVGGTAAAPASALTSGANTGDASSLQLLAGTATANNAEPNTGDFVRYTAKSPSPTKAAAMKWVELTAGAAGALRPVVVNGAGLTLYRFDKDTASPSKSNCSGACAETWPPVLVAPGGKIFLTGVAKSDVGVVKRDDGTLQVTIGGWPVYRYSKDERTGDTNGQGVGGTWFGVQPDGKKAGQTSSSGTSTPSSAGAGDSVVLFDDKDFADNGAQGTSGPGCKDLARDGVASSLRLDGGPVKIWSAPGCTGQSAVVSEDIADLSTIGFDNRIASVRFGVSGS
jgi:predicted lipoprotein with Yx(FWY)xxD motif